MNTGKNSGIANLKPWKKGVRVPGSGRPKGQRDYATIYKEALIKLASANGITADELENDILQKGLALSRKGDYRFYKDTLDRLHGQPKQALDITSGGKELPTPIYQGMSTKKKKK